MADEKKLLAKKSRDAMLRVSAKTPVSGPPRAIIVASEKLTGQNTSLRQNNLRTANGICANLK